MTQTRSVVCAQTSHAAGIGDIELQSAASFGFHADSDVKVSSSPGTFRNSHYSADCTARGSP